MRRTSAERISLDLYREEVTADYQQRGMRSTLPILCQELYFRYCMESTEETFERFYHSTMPVFLSYAVERCQEKGPGADPQEIVTRLYGILVTHAVNRRRVPFRSLFSWCFGVISNLIQEEQRFHGKIPPGAEGMERCLGGENPLEAMICAEDQDRRDQDLEQLLRLIEEPNSLLTNRERSVMSCFYCRNLTLKTIAVNLGIKREHVGVILFRARKRLIDHFQKKDRSSGHIRLN